MSHDKQPYSPPTLSLYFEPREGIAASHHQVSAEVLSQALKGFQRVVYLMAMHQERREVRLRARVTKDITTRFPIICSVPRAGSYELPLSIGRGNADLVDPEVIGIVTDHTIKALGSIERNDSEAFKSIISDNTYRRRILTEIKSNFPDAKSGYDVSLIEAERQTVFSASLGLKRASRFIEIERERPAPLNVVTGSVHKVDFETRQFDLWHPYHYNLVKCNYDEEFEFVLLENPREYVQVMGTVQLNETGTPERVTNVEDIQPIDISDIFVKNFSVGPSEITSKAGVYQVPVALSEDWQKFIIDWPELDVYLGALTRADLEASLEDELQLLWEQYALASDTDLTEDAIALKSYLHEMFEVKK